MPFHFPSDLPVTAPLALLCIITCFFAAFGGRQQQKFKWVKWYIALCFGFCLLLYFVLSLSPVNNTYKSINLIALGLYSSLECWLIFLLFRNEPLPLPQEKALNTVYSIFFYFWLLVLLGNPRFVITDTATMIAAESLTVTVLTVLRLETIVASGSFAHFMRSDNFSTVLGTLGYFSFSIPVFFLMVTLDLHDDPEAISSKTSELFTYAGFFLMTRKDLHV